MRYLLLLLLSGCSSQAVSPARPGDVLLAPVPVKAGPKAHYNTFSNRGADWDDRSFRFYLGQVKVKDFDANMQRMYGFGPVIEIRKGGELRVLDLRERHPAHCFGPVFHDKWNRRVLALVQHCVEGPASSFQVWITEDGGEHWLQGEDLARPSPGFPPSDLYTIFVDGMGKGEAWFRVGADHFTSEGTFEADMRMGAELIYKASTSDGGRTWSVGKEPALRSGLEEAEKTAR